MTELFILDIAILALTVLLLIFNKLNYVLFLSIPLMYNPFYSVILNTFGFRYSWIRVVFCVAYLGILYFYVFLRSVVGTKIHRKRTPLDAFLYIFGVIILLSMFVGIVRGNEYREVLAEVFPLFEWGAFFIIAGWLAENERQIKITIYCMFGWVLLVSIFNIFYFSTHGSAFEFKVDVGGGVFPRINDFIYAVLWPLFFVYYIYEDNFKRKLLWVFILIVGCVNVLLSSFRSVWLGVLISTLLCLVLSARKGFKLKAVQLIVLLLALFGLVYYSGSLDMLYGDINLSEAIVFRMQGEGLYQGSSLTGRLATYQIMLEQSLHIPYLFVGHGFGSYFDQYSLLPVSSAPNFFINMLYEFGLFGFGFLVFILARIYLDLFRIYNTRLTPYVNKLTVGVLGSYTCLGVVLCIFPALYNFPLAAIGAMLLAFCYQLDTSNESRSAETVHSD